MSRLDDAAQSAYSAGCTVIPHPIAVELRSVVIGAALGDQRERLLEALDSSIERFVTNQKVDSNPVSE